MMQRTTVDERARENGGFITRGGAKPLLSVSIMAGAEGKQSPPNLKDCGMGKQCCGNCASYDGQSCDQYEGYPVRANEVCDTYRAEGEGEEMGEEPEDGAVA